MNIKLQLACLACLSASLCQSPAPALLGPFVPGSGSYTVVPNGDFESGGQAGWTDFEANIGYFRTTSAAAYRGQYSSKSLVRVAGLGPGFAANKTIAVQPGQTYVLSAFFQTGGMSGATVYVDLNDAAFEPNLQGLVLSGLPMWQFAWGQFTVPTGVTSVTVRTVHDSVYHVGDSALIDDVALTPLSSFVPPTPLATEPATLEIGMFAGLFIQGTVGRPYRIEYSPVMPATNWTTLTNIYLPSSPYLWIDLTSSGRNHSYYRATAVQ